MKKLIVIISLIGLASNLTRAQEIETIEAKYSGKPIIQMTLNNKKTWVLLDTGSEYTVLDSGAKDKFNFYVQPFSNKNINVSGLGSTHNKLMETNGAQINFGYVRLRGITYAFDLTPIVKSIHNRTGKRITAIIGTHMMRNYGFVIDMGENTASITVKPKKKKKQNDKSSEEFIIAKNAK